MANPQTIIRDGSGAQTATYQLPPGLFQYIESVLVQLNNGAAVGVRPTLKVETVNGQVMATKRQGEAIPAGDTGTATWALRLSDEGGGIRFDVQNIGGFLWITAAQYVAFETEVFGVLTTGAAALIDLESDDRLKLVGTGSIETDSNGLWLISVNQILEQVATDVSIVVGAGGWTVQSSGPITLDTSPGTSDVTVRLPAGASMEVRDSSDAPIFRVNENGDLQGKTGKALTFNL